MRVAEPTRADRARGAAAAVAVQLALGYALVTGLSVDLSVRLDDGLKTFGVVPEVPPPPIPPVPQRVRQGRPEGAASPPNLRARATAIVAPPQVVPLVPPPPVTAALIADAGAAAFSGNADVRGPGTGSGGEGDGRGSGGFGDGDGSGGGDTPPRWRRGRLNNSDYPAGPGEAGIGGTVSVAYTVRPDGRVADCEITRSSGNAVLDATTCRLIEARFRYQPSRDARGRPVPSTIVENHEWVVEQLPPEPRPSRRR